MNCKSVQNRLSAYLDRELGGDELLQIRAHISTCRDCRAEADSLRALKCLLGGVSCPEPPEGLSDRLTANMMKLRHEEPRKTLRVSALMFASVTACSMLATLLIVNYGIGRHLNAPNSNGGQSGLGVASNANAEVLTTEPVGPVISVANFGPR
ncbi:MAG: anti-sigma factor [Fimbriimonas sp.]|nr:anti-sigma factor [Fimbriimonas sp.]